MNREENENENEHENNQSPLLSTIDILAMKTETDNMHAIFLLKKNVRSNIIKMILGYLPITAPKSLKKWKIAITLVGQEYKPTEGRQDYKTGLEITYGERESPMNIRKSKDKYDKDRKPIYFNYNVYKHMAKDC